ncbi:MAG: NADH-quinone oxidoreductase subunit A, partial [Nitrospinota bacterium]
MEILNRFFADYAAINRYVPVLIFVLVAVSFAAATLIFAWLIRPSRPDPEKLSPYECGIPPMTPARERFSIRFYI